MLMLLVRGLLVESFYTPSTSMEPTLTPEDRGLVNKIGGASSLQRGDHVVFDGTRTFAGPAADPGSGASAVVGRMMSSMASKLSTRLNESDYVKRVVGLRGDHVVCCDADSRAHIGDPGEGMVRHDDVIGSAGMIYAPLSRVALLRPPTPPARTSGTSRPLTARASSSLRVIPATAVWEGDW